MTPQILAIAKRVKDAKTFASYLEETARAGTRVIFFMPYTPNPLNGFDAWLNDPQRASRESPAEALQAMLRFDKQQQNQSINEHLQRVYASLIQTGVEVQGQIYSGPMNEALRHYLSANRFDSIVRRRRSLEWLRSLLGRRAGHYGEPEACGLVAVPPKPVA
jgi:hypothetical protein